ncbi:aminopeptidase [Microbulbifer sp. TYP-18]|uniref:aminopeptidase n=1 Tax=Microbulbifer sp. TYP-18 TaxID=3230024 RepID=UPI0034C674A0
MKIQRSASTVYNSQPCPRLLPWPLTGRLVVIALVSILTQGCETAGYYSQAVAGQLRILAAREPIDRVLAAPDTDEQLERQLRLVKSIRTYARDQLHLPVGRAYATYVQLDRAYPIWNVLAAPEFSLKARQWCYPIAGCASYRGYFHRDDALKKARQLTEEDYDVYLGPVPAYSTLGWFNDPVLSSFITWPADRLARLLFHELAHRRVYISGDTRFNESFATAVAELALPDWRRQRGLPGPASGGEAERRQLNQLLLQARKQLQLLYGRDMGDDSKRRQKANILARLRQCYGQMSASWPNPARYQTYIDKTNNATLALVEEYRSLVPAFRQLYLQSGGWEDFYRAVERLGGENKKARDARLQALGATYQLSNRKVTGPSFSSDTCMSAANTPLATGAN